jgi:transcriptional regulator with XRE-family HTH domain
MYEIGARIRELRGKVLTQQEVADLAGVSVQLIRALEQGSRQTATIGNLARIATALDVELVDLFNKRSSMPGHPDSGVVAIRRALTPVDDLFEDLLDDHAVSLAEARLTIDHTWGAYWGGKYDQVLTMVPNALPQLRATTHAARSDHTPEAHEFLARTYWVTGCTLVHLGHIDPAWQSIRLALDAAERGNDPLLAATIRGSIAWQLLAHGRYDESHRISTYAAAMIEPPSNAELPHLSVYGSLILGAAIAAGRDRRDDEAWHLVSEASGIAERIGSDRHDYETYFGPSQVIMQTVDIGVNTENYAVALDASRKMPRESGLPLASRCRHLADKALAHGRLGNDQKALDALLAAESMGPDWMKHQTLPRRIIAELLDRDRRSRLRSLARRLGVTA